MRRSIFILLLGILLIQSGGLMIFYQFRQIHVKHEMLRILKEDKGEYVELDLSLADYRECLLNKREILYQGEMYDIRSESISGNNVHLKVIKDSREKRLMEKIKMLAGGMNQQNRDLPSRIVKLFSISYVVPGMETGALCPENSVIRYASTCSDYDHLKSDILSPPPEFI